MKTELCTNEMSSEWTVRKYSLNETSVEKVKN